MWKPSFIYLFIFWSSSDFETEEAETINGVKGLHENLRDIWQQPIVSASFRIWKTSEDQSFPQATKFQFAGHIWSLGRRLYTAVLKLLLAEPIHVLLYFRV